jgi:hypothetical protein
MSDEKNLAKWTKKGAGYTWKQIVSIWSQLLNEYLVRQVTGKCSTQTAIHISFVSALYMGS